VGASPYPPIEQWHVARAAVTATLTSVAVAGRRGDEAGVFWLGRRAATTTIDAVVSLRGPGVFESPGLWQVSSEVYGVVSRLASAAGRVLLATAHTHGRGVPVALSRTDRRHGVRVPDFLALVIGNGGDAPDPAEWSWNAFDDGDFRRLDADEYAARVRLVAAGVALYRANADGAGPWSGAEDE
jgi:hypothetical protein